MADKAPQAMAGALYREAEAIMADSKLKVPVGWPPEDPGSGTLRSTGHVDLPVISGSEIEVTEGYGGPAAHYALRQHEELAWSLQQFRPNAWGPVKWISVGLVTRSSRIRGRTPR